MPSHNSSLSTIECGYCHNSLTDGDPSIEQGGSAYCSAACVILADEAHDRVLRDVICTNCESACPDSRSIVFSPDGLPFCGAECAGRYPKMVADPQVKRVLCTAAAGMFLAAGVAILAIAESVSTLARHP